MVKSAISLEQDQRNERKLMMGIACGLLLLGAVHSAIFFGHEQVPNPDFTGFMHVGHKLWSFELPEHFKRAPLLGLLVVPLGWLVGGPYPDLTAGWILNAVLHPLNMILLWLVAKRLIGQAGLWLSLVAMINPWVIYLLTQPIAETTLTFFCLLSFYLMFKRSRWSYLAAALTTMVRYEGAALILATFVLDLVYGRNKEERLRCLFLAFLASIPLALWIIGMLLQWQHLDETHYLHLLLIDKLKETPQILRTLWKVTFSSLIINKPGIPWGVCQLILRLTKILFASAFVVSFIHAVWKRKWNMLALYIFFLPYIFVHVIYYFSVPRFYITVHWMLLIFCFDGLFLIWTWFCRTVRLPDVVFGIMQSIIGFGVLIWFIILASNLPELKSYSPTSYYFPHLTLVAIGLMLAYQLLIERFRHWRSRLLTMAILLFIVTSNQYRLAPTLGPGNELIEFKHVTEWFLQNGEPECRLGSSLANVMQIFATGQSSRLVNIGSIQADSPESFFNKCRERQICYLA